MPMKSTFLSRHLVLYILIMKLAITGASIKSRLWLNDIDLYKTDDFLFGTATCAG